jgi:tight adherence protein B
MDLAYTLFLVLGFLAVVMLTEGLYLTWNTYRGPQALRVARRLQSLSAADPDVAAPLIRKRLLSELPAVEALLLRVPRVHVLDRFLLQSGMNLTVASFAAVTFTLAFGGLAAAAFLGLPAALLALAALVPPALWAAYVQHRRLGRMRLIDEQLPDALDLMARAMQVGHAFSSALRLVGTEGPQPIATEFQTVFDEVNLGIPVGTAMKSLATRVTTEDLRFFVVAVMIQTETGGNLAEILMAIAALIRERQKLRRSVRVLSAESRLSAWILAALPFLVGGAVSVINMQFISLLWTDRGGLALLISVASLMAVGILWMWRMVRIRV